MFSVSTLSVTAYDIKGDIDRDSCFCGQDITKFCDYLLKKESISESQHSICDMNGDGLTDVFDLALMRKTLNQDSKRMPYGCWVGMDSSNGKRYFWFENGKGNVISESSLVGAGYNFEVNNNTITFAMGSADSFSSAYVTWIDSRNIMLKWDYGETEHLRYFYDKPVDCASLLTGDWYTFGGNGQRHFSIQGITGSCTDSNGKTERFEYQVNGSKYIFHIVGKGAVTAEISKVDSGHFTLKWSDGKTETFSHKGMQVIDGITYVDGIMIANKSYSLPSSYNPNGLTSEVQNAFNEMTVSARNDGISLWICSGFRSYSYQQELYNNYVYWNGQAVADTFSARAGHSEHQTGLAIDVNMADSSFEGTPQAVWLAENCWKYGFIIRYPKGKQNITGYMYEPWHVRYLGKNTAKAVYETGLTLEEYLGIDSVYR